MSVGTMPGCISLPDSNRTLSVLSVLFPPAPCELKRWCNDQPVCSSFRYSLPSNPDARNSAFTVSINSVSYSSCQ